MASQARYARNVVQFTPAGETVTCWDWGTLDGVKEQETTTTRSGTTAALTYVYDDAPFTKRYKTLRTSNFGFSVPADATITAIKLSLEYKAFETTADPNLLDFEGFAEVNAGHMFLYNGTTGLGTDYDPGFYAPNTWSNPTEAASWQYIELGGSDTVQDTLGATLTPAIVNNCEFGTALWVELIAQGSTDKDGNPVPSLINLSLDYIKLEVFYSGGTGNTSIDQGNMFLVF